MRVVIDTNVLVSAVLRDRDPELVVQFVVDHPDFVWVASQHISTEYQEVLNRRKFRLTQDVKDKWFNLLNEALIFVEVDISVDFPIDPDDAMFIACAITADADFLITSDADLFQGKSLFNTAVATVANFKALFCDLH